MNFPILSSLILLPVIGAFFIFINKSGTKSDFRSSKYVAVFTSFSNFIISIYLGLASSNLFALPSSVGVTR